LSAAIWRYAVIFCFRYLPLIAAIFAEPADYFHADYASCFADAAAIAIADFDIACSLCPRQRFQAAAISRHHAAIDYAFDCRFTPAFFATFR